MSSAGLGCSQPVLHVPGRFWAFLVGFGCSQPFLSHCNSCNFTNSQHALNFKTRLATLHLQHLSKTSQEHPKLAKNTQNWLGTPKTSQKRPKLAKNTQNLPRTPKTCQEQPKPAKNTQNQPRTYKAYQKHQNQSRTSKTS